MLGNAHASLGPLQVTRSFLIGVTSLLMSAACGGGDDLAVAEIDAWVTADRLNRRTCPQPTCGSVGVQFFREGVTIYEQKNGWARITRPYDASCFNGVSEYVDSGENACDAANGIVNGRIAE